MDVGIGFGQAQTVQNGDLNPVQGRGNDQLVALVADLEALLDQS